ncbi:hypothetical protein D3C81_1664820 [compost metagenome]
MAGDGAETVGQAITFAGAGNAHEVELHTVWRIHPCPQCLDQQFIGHFDDRADHCGRQFAVDGFADHRAVDLRGGQRIDTETGDHQKHVGRVRRLAQLAHFAPQVRVDHVQKQHAAQKVRGTHRVAPDTDDTDQENEVLRLGVERGHRQRHGDAHQ